MAFTPAPNASRYTPVNTIPVPGAASAAPNPPYSGIYIPQIWSSKLVEKFYDATVLAAIANTDYEGEIQSYGDTVNIRTRPDVAIRDYAPDQALEVERPSGNMVQLLIDQGHYFNCILDDVYKVQADIDLMNIWAEDASEQMKIKVDTNVLAALPTTVAAANRGLTAGRISGDINLGVTGTPVPVVPRGATAGDVNIVDLILDLGQTLDEQNIPETNRFLIVPSWASSMIKKSELRDASLTGDGVSMLRNGRIGTIDRFTVYASNLLPNPGAAGEHFMIAGSPVGMTFAAQMTEMETLRAQSTFGTLMRGLMVYGFETIKDVALASAVVAKG
jgi:hypothetical protein